MKLIEPHLRILKKLAISSGKKGNLPNSAIIINKDGVIKGYSESLVATNTDATAHAERLVIEKVCKKNHLPVIPEYNLITILEPCLMCISASYWAGIKNIYYIISSSKFYNDLPWITESKKINKIQLINQFEEKINIIHLKEYETEFIKLFSSYIKRVIKRPI